MDLKELWAWQIWPVQPSATPPCPKFALSWILSCDSPHQSFSRTSLLYVVVWFFPGTWLNLLPLRLSLKVWPVIWLKLNDIQEFSVEGERQTQQGSSVGKPTWKVRNEMNGEKLWALNSSSLNNIFWVFSSHNRDPGATFSHGGKEGRLLLEKDVERDQCLFSSPATLSLAELDPSVALFPYVRSI